MQYLGLTISRAPLGMATHTFDYIEFVFILAGGVTQVLDLIAWVRCASGNVYYSRTKYEHHKATDICLLFTGNLKGCVALRHFHCIVVFW